MSEQVLRSQPATISATFYDTSGEVVDPGAVTVTVAGADGTVVVNGQAASGTGETARTYLLTASDTAQLDILTYTFTSVTLDQSVTGEVEVVGAYLFTIDEARDFHDGALAGAAYTVDKIEAARERITDAFEERCEVSFIRRYRRTVVSGRSGCALLLPDYGVYVVRSIEVRDSDGWTAWTEDELATVQLDPIGQIDLDTGRFSSALTRNYRIGYEYGWPQPPPDIKRAALIVARNQLVSSDLSDRTTSISSEAGTFSLATAGTQPGNGAYRHYGYPEVDEALATYWRRLPRGR